MLKRLLCATTVGAISYKTFAIKKRANMLNETPSKNLFAIDSTLNTDHLYPIIYSNKYDLSFYGFEKLHSFDTKKWAKILYNLQQHYKLDGFIVILPSRPIDNEEMALVHTQEFITQLHSSSNFLASAVEIFLVKYLPVNYLINNLLTPFKWHTSGSILAAFTAIKHGSAINLGGGFHHASAKYASGFCLIADISLIIKYLWKHLDSNLNFLIVDLDAHQGNGHARDKHVFSADEQAKVYIFDVYNKDVFPRDRFAKDFIDKKVEVCSGISDDEYLALVKLNLDEILNDKKPDLIIYNAGTDILAGDLLGKMNISENAIIERDEFIFSRANQNNVPVVMLTSGGYQRSNANIIARSIINLINKDLIKLINKAEFMEKIVANGNPQCGLLSNQDEPITLKHKIENSKI